MGEIDVVWFDFNGYLNVGYGWYLGLWIYLLIFVLVINVGYCGNGVCNGWVKREVVWCRDEWLFGEIDWRRVIV